MPARLMDVLQDDHVVEVVFEPFSGTSDKVPYHRLRVVGQQRILVAVRNVFSPGEIGKDSRERDNANMPAESFPDVWGAIMRLWRVPGEPITEGWVIPIENIWKRLLNIRPVHVHLKRCRQIAEKIPLCSRFEQRVR